MTLHEPVTLLTDYLLALLGGVCGWRLRRRAGGENVPQLWWSRALWFTAMAAAVGGTYHGVGPMLSGGTSAGLWRATLLLIGLTSAAMALMLVHEMAPQAQRRLWQGLVWAKFGGFALVALAWPVFLVAMIDYGLAMLALAAAAALTRRAWRGPMLAALALSALAAAVQQRQWGLSARFNHNDVYHVIQGGAVFLFYRAGRQLGATNSRQGGPGRTACDL